MIHDTQGFRPTSPARNFRKRSLTSHWTRPASTLSPAVLTGRQRWKTISNRWTGRCVSTKIAPLTRVSVVCCLGNNRKIKDHSSVPGIGVEQAPSPSRILMFANSNRVRRKLENRPMFSLNRVRSYTPSYSDTLFVFFVGFLDGCLTIRKPITSCAHPTSASAKFSPRTQSRNVV